MHFEQKARIIVRVFAVICSCVVYFALGAHYAAFFACLVVAIVVWGACESARARAAGARGGAGASLYGAERESASEEAARARRNPNSVLRGAGNR